jgi:hypothetical protein
MRKIVLGVLLALSAAVLPALPAAASPPAVTTGTDTVVSDTMTQIKTVGNATFYVEHLIVTYTGTTPTDLSGTETDVDILKEGTDGSLSAHGTAVCSCTLAGRSGGDIGVYNYQGNTVSGVGGHLTVLLGTGGFSGLHLEGNFFPTGTFEYYYHFDR